MEPAPLSKQWRANDPAPIRLLPYRLSDVFAAYCRLQGDAMNLLTIIDVYGDTHHIDGLDWESSKTQLPLYTAAGAQLSSHYERMKWHHKPTTIHRDNILQIKGEQSR